MESKLIEIRDRGTFIPAMAVQISAADGYLARRAGFGTHPLVYLIHMEGERCAYDPYTWPESPRTMRIAHEYIERHWDELSDGAVVDVEYALDESAEPKRSEQETVPG